MAGQCLIVENMKFPDNNRPLNMNVTGLKMPNQLLRIASLAILLIKIGGISISA